MSSSTAKNKHPFFWSLVFSGLSILAIELGILFFRRYEQTLAILCSLAGIGFLILEMVLFLPSLVRNAFKNSPFLSLFRINLPGFLYFIFIFLLAVSAINTGNNLLYLILAFMIAAILASGIAAWISLSRLNISIDYQDTIFARQHTSYRLRLTNAKRWLPSFSIGIEGWLINQTWFAVFSSSDPKEKYQTSGQPVDAQNASSMRTVAYCPFLPGKAQDCQTFQVLFPYRGLYMIDQIDVTTSFPFGFFRKGRRIRTSGELVVYPELLEKESFFAILEQQSERMPHLRKGLGAELHTLREYIPGEDVRHIHWKASARTGRLIIKEFAMESQDHFIFLLDETVSGTPSDYWAKYERAVSFLATLLLEFQERGKSVQIVFSHCGQIEKNPTENIAEQLNTLSCSYLRSEPILQQDHPFNIMPTDEAFIHDGHSCAMLCSFHQPGYFPQYLPYIDNYLDMNQL